MTSEPEDVEHANGQGRPVSFLGWRMRPGMHWRNLVGLIAGELHRTMEHG